MRIVPCIIATLPADSATPAHARNDRLKLPIADALATGSGTIDRGFKLYFGSRGGPPGCASLGGFTANRRTNAGNRSDKQACDWAFLSAVLSLPARARKEGGDAIIRIASVHKRSETTSSAHYVCGAGSVMTSVALRDRVVKLAR